MYLVWCGPGASPVVSRRTVQGRDAFIMSRCCGADSQAASVASARRIPNAICFGIIDLSATHARYIAFVVSAAITLLVQGGHIAQTLPGYHWFLFIFSINMI